MKTGGNALSSVMCLVLGAILSLHAKTPVGQIMVTLHQREDCFTLHEVFGLECYFSEADSNIVDLGSNIGISALYFLSRNESCKVFCYEPLPENIVKLRANLKCFSGRYSLSEVAVSAFTGRINLNVEPTGRYSGIDCSWGEAMSFNSVSAHDVLDEIIDAHGRIDLLKVDIEGAEKYFISELSARTLKNIELIYIESDNDVQIATYTKTLTLGGVQRFDRLSALQDTAYANSGWH